MLLMAINHSRSALPNPANHAHVEGYPGVSQTTNKKMFVESRACSVDISDFRYTSHDDLRSSALPRCLSSLLSQGAQQVEVHAYLNNFTASALHAQHWWFSGKIGRCHKKLLNSRAYFDIGQPRVRFPADAST
jgi:hypothetical protein